MVSVEFNDINTEALTMDVYPNPVNSGSDINVKTSSGYKSILLVMVNSLGQEFFVKTFVDVFDGFYVIQTYDIPVGVYIITASSNDEYVSKKIIVR